jgi:hypothetical protein
MLTIEPQTTIQSTAVPGVTYTVRNLNRIQRASREFSLMEARYRIGEIYSEFRALADELKMDPENVSILEIRLNSSATPPQKKRAALLEAELQILLNRDIKPATIHAGLISIEGVQLGDKPADTESILSGDPKADALLDEIFAACEDSAGLLEKQRKNSASPAISSEPAAGDPAESSPTAEPAAG